LLESRDEDGTLTLSVADPDLALYEGFRRLPCPYWVPLVRSHRMLLSQPKRLSPKPRWPATACTTS
ncbi:hypothetical protein, partial [Alistipes senegalensis]|uniref:hypothetical protein n=1 Tax=Alistipes senegalensis TaxID=1288121 RepID=UPI001E4CCF29